MKLATLKNNTRDGQLVVVNRALTHCQAVPDLAATLQQTLDDWANVAPRLQRVYESLNSNPEQQHTFDPTLCHSPLPRAYQWADGSAYVNHVELVRKARNAEMPESFWRDPLMYQGGSDSFLGPRDDIPVASKAWGIDFEAEIAVITNDLPMGASVDDSEKSICLFMLVNDVSLRSLIPAELAKGFGFFQSKPSSAFSPVAVTADELGSAWHDGRVHLPLRVDFNQQAFGRAHAGRDMTFNFPQLIAHAAKTRPMSAGAIIGSGTVSNKHNTDHGLAIGDGGLGYSCIAEVRMIETIEHGAPKTSFMQYGDRVHIDMHNDAGESIFGAIDQQVVPYPET